MNKLIRCECGVLREYKSGVTKGKEWRALFCGGLQAYSRCAPVWLRRSETIEQCYQRLLSGRSPRQ